MAPTSRRPMPGIAKMISMIRVPPISRPILIDRKSTRLNSSHQIISYAVFCLKKKNIKPDIEAEPKKRDEIYAGKCYGIPHFRCATCHGTSPHTYDRCDQIYCTEHPAVVHLFQ